jgi:hypothetical protein
VAVGAAVVTILATLSLLLAARWHDPQPYSGDEPHYVLISNSLILDGDVDVKNDYLDERYLKWYPYPIDPHVNVRIFTAASPHWYSQHGVGLPALLVPAVVLDDARGASVAMVLVALVVLVLAFLWARRFTQEWWPAAVAAAVLGLSPFFLGLEGRIFPDLATAALLLGCLLILEMRERRSWHLLLLGALVGVSPWIHVKDAPVFGAIVLVAFVQLARTSVGRVRNLLLFGVPVIVSVIGYELAIRSWYGSWLPTHMFPPGTNAFSITPWRGIAAASFDSSRGLLSINPALLLILAGLPLWLSRWRYPFLRLAFVIAPSIVVQATYRDWSGGYAPAGRYALQFAPALIPAIALVLSEARGAFRVLAGAVIGFQWALAAAFVWLHPSWGFAGQRSPFLAAVDKRIGLAVDRAMPTFDVHGGLVRGGWQLAAWIAVSGTLVAYGAVLAGGRPTKANRAVELRAMTPLRK